MLGEADRASDADGGIEAVTARTMAAHSLRISVSKERSIPGSSYGGDGAGAPGRPSTAESGAGSAGPGAAQRRPLDSHNGRVRQWGRVWGSSDSPPFRS